MQSLAYLFLEVSTVVLFGLTIWHARRRGGAALWELGAAAVYGVLLEWGDILLFRTYHYSPQFWLAIGPVPIVIGLCWGMIIYGAMAYSDQLGLVGWAAPFADAIWAIVLDLAFDAVAIRLQFWTWSNPLNTGYFGVPADNFFAWLFVALSFSAYVRWVRRQGRIERRTRWMYLAAPVWAFIGLLLGILLYKGLAAAFYPAGVPVGGSLPIFAAALAVFAAIVGWGIWRKGVRVQPGIDLIPLATRLGMHGYFLGWALLLVAFPALRLPGMDMPLFLVWIALALLAVEAAMVLPLLQRNAALRRQVRIMPRAETQRESLAEPRHAVSRAGR